MSRQRIRTSVLESSTEKCPYCGGSGHVRSVSSLALQVLRALEEQLMKGATHNLIARTRPDVALYVLNQKRAHLRGLEERFAITITISADESVAAPQAFVIDRGEQVHTPEAAKALAERTQADAAPLEDEDDLEDIAAAEEEGADEAASPATVPEQGEEGGRRRRRRRRRGGRNGTGEGAQDHGPDRGHDRDGDQADHERVAITGPDAGSGEDFAADGDQEAAGDDETGEQELAPQNRSENGEPRRDGGERRRRRGRRGGRRNRHRNGNGDFDRNRPEGHPEGHDDHQAGSEQDFASAEELSAHPTAEPSLNDAVADLDTPPSRAPREEPARAESRAEPARTEPAESQPAEHEPARRRSTVRERAPITSSDAAAPVPTPAAPPASEPAATESNGEAAGDQPRRTGWWSRRFAGN
jgi:ribonuclease E